MALNLKVFYLLLGKLLPMLNIENLTDFTLECSLLEDIANHLTTREIDLTLCYNSAIQ
jgi:hypothetical protein